MTASNTTPEAARHRPPHTQGPLGVWDSIYEGMACEVRVIEPGRERAIAEVRKHPNAYSDALLFASAPAMLEALKGFVAEFEQENPQAVGKDEDWIYDEHRGVGVAYLSAREAIRLATGAQA